MRNMSYLLELDKLNSIDYLTQQIITNKTLAIGLCDIILKTLNFYLEGYPHKAFSELSTYLTNHRNNINVLITPDDISEHIHYLYRARLGDRKTFVKKDLFHLPFELRHKVEPRRYSIPGLPCLYLGGSTYVCWEEFGRPNLAHVHICRFEPQYNVQLKVLDFGYRAAHVAAYVNANRHRLQHPCKKVDFVVGQVILWPLIASSSIQVLEPDSPFKPEYVISQLLLQWLTDSTDCDGIRYFSTHIENYPNSIIAVSNFAFPVRTNADNGHCSVLKSKFQLSEPLFWQLATAAPPHSGNAPNVQFDLEIAKGVKVPYVRTEFGAMQYYLANMKCSPL